MSRSAIPIPSFLQKNNKKKDETIPYTAPDALANEATVNNALVELQLRDDCAICQTSLFEKSESPIPTEMSHTEAHSMEATSNMEQSCYMNHHQRSVVALKSCGHVFHRNCITSSLVEREPNCPLCQALVHVPAGRCPSGTMTVRIRHDQKCPGYEPATIISILYKIPSGTQKPYHQNPGLPHDETERVAYLPNNAQGQELLTRLTFAWKQGLIFCVGRSLTTNKDNVVTWTTIPHKTSLYGGPFGFPDDAYLSNCHAALNALGVPTAHEINTGIVNAASWSSGQYLPPIAPSAPPQY